ncbi:MAG: hypothetical protein Q9160_001883 [Pyrenula sp. 1 TL-2023]
MATPARLAQGSTPKSAAVLTPSNITSSPHASHSAPPPKGFSGKSPAIKTPSSLGHGHSHNLSTSSHPISTPLAAMMAGEDPMSFNSPATAAVMAQLGSRGLTPLAGGNEGLGISSDAIGLKSLSGPTTRNPEEERIQRLRQAIENLKPRIASHGVCREGIENLGPIAGFSPFWQEDTLTIAGDHLVDLEIEFESANSDKIKDVSLKIGAPGSSEAARNDAASSVLKRNLTESKTPSLDIPWRDLRAFASNLERLGNLDRLSSNLNCFKALEGLEESFIRYWDEEQRHKQNQGPLEMLSTGSIGRPFLHEGDTVGLGLEYWAPKKKLHEARKRTAHESAMDIDTPRPSSHTEKLDATIWTARIDCEAGFPPLHVSKAWIAEEALLSNNNDSEDMEAIALHPAWQDPQTSGPDAMAVDGPNARFVAKLDPVIHLPVMVASSVFDQTLAGPWIQKPVKPLEAIISDSMVLDPRRVQRLDTLRSTHDLERASTTSWTKNVSSVDKGGMLKEEKFEYRLKSEQNMCQVFRQYALLDTLVKSIACIKNDAVESNVRENQSNKSSPARRSGIRKSNKASSDNAKLNVILGKQEEPFDGRTALVTDDFGARVVDVSLRLVSLPPSSPCIDLFFSRAKLGKEANLKASTNVSKTSLLSIEVALNGHLTISNVGNLPGLSSESMRRRMAEILDLSEDLTVLIAWVLQQEA